MCVCVCVLQPATPTHLLPMAMHHCYFRHFGRGNAPAPTKGCSRAAVPHVYSLLHVYILPPFLGLWTLPVTRGDGYSGVPEGPPLLFLGYDGCSQKRVTLSGFPICYGAASEQ